MSDSNTATTDGVLEQRDDGTCVLHFERHLAHPVESVWAALTEPDQVEGWLAKAEVELVEGGSVVLWWQNEISREQVAEYDIKGLEDEDLDTPRPVRGTVTRIDPPRLLEYNTDAHGLLRWELRDSDGGCVLHFSSTLTLPEEMRTQVLAGWHTHLDGLEALLAGHPTDPAKWPIEEWAEHRARYAETLE